MTRFYHQIFVAFFLWGSSLTWRRVCNLFVQLLLELPSAVNLGSKSRRAHYRILLPHLRLVPVLSPLTILRVTVEVFQSISTRLASAIRITNWDNQRQAKVKVILRPTVSRPVCPVVRPLSRIRDQWFFRFHGICLTHFLFICLNTEHPFWRETGSVVFLSETAIVVSLCQ
jgi:hypothetical protein